MDWRLLVLSACVLAVIFASAWLSGDPKPEPLGSEANPLTDKDLPFSVPKTGRYWVRHGGRLTRLPESPKGSVLAFEEAEPNG